MKKIITLLKTIPLMPMMNLMTDWKCFVRFHYLHAAYESGLIEACQKPVTKDELIKKLNVKRPDLLDALLHIALALKEIKMKNNRYILKGRRSKMLLGSKGDKFAAWIQAHVNYYNAAYRDFSERLKGAPDGDYLDVHGDLIAKASKMLDPFVNLFIESSMRSNEPLRILEGGCGSGIYLKKAYECNNNLHGIAVDYHEDVVKQAENNIKEWKLEHAFKAIKGDIINLKDEHTEAYDIVTMYSVLYYFPLNNRLDVIKKIKSYLKDNGRLILVSSEQGKSPTIGSANLDLINRSAKGCFEVPENGEIEKLLIDAGFKIEKIDKIFPGDTVYGYIARK